MTITREYFIKATGREPEQDDLERCNCLLAGEPMHDCCGWDTELNLPVFEAMAVRLKMKLERDQKGEQREGLKEIS